MDQKYEAFIKAAEVGSFKGAADLLGYTQAGISYLISSLEKEMGTTLFLRDHAGARLTVDGQALLPWIQDVYNSERALRSKLGEMRDLETGTVRIAASASVSIHWLPGIFEQFMARHPRIKLEVACFEDQEDMEDRVRAGEYDCCFLIEPSRRGFFTIPLMLDPLYVVVPPSHPLAREQRFPSEALAREPYVKVRNDSHTEIDALFERHGVTPRTRLEMDNDFAVMGMVSKGLGYGVFPQLILKDNPFDLALVEPEFPSPRTISIAVRSYAKASFATRAFVEATRRWISDRQACAQRPGNGMATS